MTDKTSNNHSILDARGTDAHGQAAILLVESLIHGLIARQVISVAEAVEIVDVATEVKMESGFEHGETDPKWQASINLLQNISASLRFDLGDNGQRGTP